MESSWLLSKNPKTDEYKYNRIGHHKENKVKSLISNQFGVDFKQVSLATSGIETFALTMQIIMIENKFRKMNIIYSNELYCDTPRYLNYFSTIYGVSQNFIFDVNNQQDLINNFENKFKGQINILFFETCSNPTGKIFDFSVIQKLRSLSGKLYVIVDNTWLSSVSFNPLHHGADIVVTSTSKYYSCGSCLGGFIVSPIEFAKNLNNFIRIGGHHIALPYCDKLIQHIPTMENRIKFTSKIAITVANFLEKHPKIMEVYHPSLQSNKGNTLANKYFKYMPSVISFKINLGIFDAKKFMSSFKTIDFKTSFGARETKFDTWPKKVSNQVTICRLAIGSECKIEALLDELNQKLSLI